MLGSVLPHIAGCAETSANSNSAVLRSLQPPLLDNLIHTRGTFVCAAVCVATVGMGVGRRWMDSSRFGRLGGPLRHSIHKQESGI